MNFPKLQFTAIETPERIIPTDIKVTKGPIVWEKNGGFQRTITITYPRRFVKVTLHKVKQNPPPGCDAYKSYEFSAVMEVSSELRQAIKEEGDKLARMVEAAFTDGGPNGKLFIESYEGVTVEKAKRPDQK